MLLTFKWMIIFTRFNPIKEFATSFLSLVLHAVNLLIWKKILSLILFKIMTVYRLNTLLRVLLMGRSGCQDVPLREGKFSFFFGGGSPYKPKSLNFALLWDITPTKIYPPCPLITDYILGKKVSLIAFREILPKILPEGCIFSNTIINYLKQLVGIKSFNAKQCSSGLSPRIIPHYPLNIYGKPWECRRIPATAKSLLISPNRKSPLINLLLPLYQKCHSLPMK